MMYTSGSQFDRSETACGNATYDLAVIGGGIGGLALAALAQKSGLRTVLFESHTRLGGCAGYFDRGEFMFDCGATALMGMNPGEPIRSLLEHVGCELQVARTPEYRMCLPDGDLFLTSDDQLWENEMRCRFPNLGESAVRFWKIQRRIGTTLFRASSGLPHVPIQGIGDIIHNLRILGFSGSIATLGTTVTVHDLMRVLGVHRDPRFVAIVAMLLQDTAQAGPDVVPLANASACLQAYRLGLSRPFGGMRAFAEGLGEAFVSSGGNLRRGTLVDSVIPNPGSDVGFRIKTRRGQTFETAQIAMNLPLDRCATLLGRDMDESPLERIEKRTRPAWSAFTAYASIEAEAVARHPALFHHVLQDYGKPIHDGNNALISLSPPEDTAYAPAHLRTITMSTHVSPEPWFTEDRTAYESLKADYADRMRSAMNRAFPGIEGAIRHIEFATPRSFARYTRRTLGRVGGPPVSRSRSNLMAVDPGVLGPGLWVVGDSVFPGQGTMAVVMCAMRVLERMTGRRWSDNAMRNIAD
ncbi:NAD(P)-binding protein [bacterium]|nr:NAD(P)-binding protein [bacterium]